METVVSFHHKSFYFFCKKSIFSYLPLFLHFWPNIKSYFLFWSFYFALFIFFTFFTTLLTILAIIFQSFSLKFFQFFTSFCNLKTNFIFNLFIQLSFCFIIHSYFTTLLYKNLLWNLKSLFVVIIFIFRYSKKKKKDKIRNFLSIKKDEASLSQMIEKLSVSLLFFV
jgi:hypothetical protein